MGIFLNGGEFFLLHETIEMRGMNGRERDCVFYIFIRFY